MKNRQLYSIFSVVASLFILLIAVVFIYGHQPVKPGIVLVMADDMGYECLSCNGSTSYSTPVLDDLAGEGIRFTNCYSQPLCTPSRVKIMTGKYNYRNYEFFGYLNPDQRTFANMLKESGYATCIAGKWQLNGVNYKNEGWEDSERPFRFGFDEYCLWQMNHAGSDGERYANPLITRNGKDLPRVEDAYGPDIFCDYILDFIDRKAGKPFLVYYPMVLVHNPFVPTPDSPEWSDKNNRYKADTSYFKDMMAYTDKNIGRILAKLKEKKIFDNTLFIFTADNGTNVNIISSVTNGKVKGGKGFSINTGNHVPMIVSWPRIIEKSGICSEMIDFSDFLPTLAEAAGADPSGFNPDGKSFMDLLQGKDRDKNEIFIHYSPRWGKFKSDRWVMNKTYKLYRDGRFYNTKDDILEKKPLKELSAGESAIQNRFREMLNEKEAEFPFEWNDTIFSPQK